MGNGNGNPPADPPPKPEFKDWALKTAGTIIGGIGLATWMVIIGSAVLWVRFEEAGIPPLQAVSVQSRSEALAQGAQVTIFFVLIALAAVAVMYVSDAHETKGDQKEPSDPHSMGWWTLGVIVVLAVLAIFWVFLGPDLGALSTVILVLLAIVLAAAALLMGFNQRKNFWALAGVVFVAVVVFAGVAQFLIVKEEKFVQAVAILRDENDNGVAGFFVASNDEKIYIANAIGPEKPQGKPVQTIKLGTEATYAVGPLESQENATARAHSMLARLIEVREANPPGPEHPEASAQSSDSGSSGEAGSQGATAK
jgi:hypothetical protein